jgi:hypothetical protein
LSVEANIYHCKTLTVEETEGKKSVLSDQLFCKSKTSPKINLTIFK